VDQELSVDELELLRESAWVREVEIDEVIEAVLSMTLGDDAQAFARARHVGMWCAKIATAVPFGPDPAFARHVGALSDADPDVLANITELHDFAAYIRDYQNYALQGGANPRTMSLIVSTAAEFDARLVRELRNRSASLSRVLRSMAAGADRTARPFVEALAIALRRKCRRR
jgi:hypothetical protein